MRSLCLLGLSLGGIELTLQLVSIVGRGLHFEQSLDGSTKRILTLGESTTADLGAIPPSSSWPRQLERLLKKNHDVQVINKGDVATNTTAIIKALPGYIDQYQPHIVIAMMGINDQGLMGIKNQYLPVYEDKTFRLLSLELIKNLSSFLLAKRDQWQRERLDKASEHHFHRLKKQLQNQEVHLDELMNYAEGLSSKEKLLYLDQLPYFIFQKMGREVGASQAVLVIYEERLGLDYDEEVALEFLYHAKRSGVSEKCGWFLKQFGEKDLDLKVLGRLVECLGRTSQLTDYIKQRSDFFMAPLDQREGLTKRNYLTLYRYLKDREICLIVMGYPLAQTKPKAYFEDHLSVGEKGLWFLDHDQTFQDALRENEKEDLFYDLFAGDFGHTTPLGSSLIAQNVHKLVAQILSQNQCPRSNQE